MIKSVALIVMVGAMFDTVTADVFVAVKKFVTIFVSRLRRAKKNAVAPLLEDCSAAPPDHASAQIQPAVHS
jgi:hypothetical protein